jgi:hypothetical protein
MLTYVQGVSDLLDDSLKFHVDKRKVRRQSFGQYIRQSAAIGSLCRQLCGNNVCAENAVIVFGAAECSSGFGYFPGPVKKLVDHLKMITRVVVIDEHYTSQVNLHVRLSLSSIYFVFYLFFQFYIYIEL